jgi:hypothetical protein
MVDRPDWSGNSGGLPAPASPSPDEVIAALESGTPPTREQQIALGVEPTAPATAVSTQVRDDKGRIIRPDWNQKAPVPVSKDPTRPDWTDGKPRNETGQFVSKSEGELRQQWERESGVAHVAQVVTAKEKTMYSLAPSLEAKVAEHLDRDFLMKAADHLRLSPGHGPEGFWRSVEQFENSLSPSERDAWARFCRSLDEDEQAALLYGLSK